MAKKFKNVRYYVNLTQNSTSFEMTYENMKLKINMLVQNYEKNSN